MKLSFKGLTGLRVFGKTIYGLMKGQIFIYQPGTLQEAHLALPAPLGPADRVQIVFGGVYVLRNGNLFFYKVDGAG